MIKTIVGGFFGGVFFLSGEVFGGYSIFLSTQFLVIPSRAPGTHIVTGMETRPLAGKVCTQSTNLSLWAQNENHNLLAKR